MDYALTSAANLLAEGGEVHLGWGMFAYSAVVFAVIAVFVVLMRRGLKDRVFKNPVTQMAEQAYLFVEGLCVGVIGAHGKKYVPMMLTLWLIIFTSNVVGLLLPHTPTADWSLNLGLAIVVVAYVQFEGMKVHFVHDVDKGANPIVAAVASFFKHLRHFAGPKMHWSLLPITLLLFFIEIISELLRILTLSLRLYGNIHGGHQVRDSLDHIVHPIAVGGGQIPVALGILVLPLEFLVCIIQAMVFTILSCVYLALVTQHHDDDETHDDVHVQPQHATVTAA